MEIRKLTYSKSDGTIDEFHPAAKEMSVVPANNEDNQALERSEISLSADYQKSDGTISATILFVLSGGEERERKYLKPLDNMKRMVVAFASKAGQGLSPRQMITIADEAVADGIFHTQERDYKIEEGDIIYLLQDVDQFEGEIRTIWKEYHTHNIHWIISNPCFEIWLYYHYSDEPPYQKLGEIEDLSIAERSICLKQLLHTVFRGSVSPLKAMEFMQDAIRRSRKYYAENDGVPALYATQMDRLAEQILQADVSKEIEAYWNAERAKRNKWKQKMQVVQRVRLSGVKVNAFGSALKLWDKRYKIPLPSITEESNSLTIVDNRAFTRNIKIGKCYLDDSVTDVAIDLEELFVPYINQDVLNYYYTQTILQTPIVTYNVYRDQIADAIWRTGIETEHYSALFTFCAPNISVPIYQMRNDGHLIYIMHNEYLPRFGWKKYEGNNPDFGELGQNSKIYTNLHRALEEKNKYGVSVMRVGQFRLPPAGNYRMICLNVIDPKQGTSDLERINKRSAVWLQYEINDIVSYKNVVTKIVDIKDNGAIELRYGKEVTIDDLVPVQIDGVHDKSIYYAPVVAASTIGDDMSIPIREIDRSYYMDAFRKEVWQEDGQTTWDKVSACRFRYVHELQHWLRTETLQDGLEIDWEEEMKTLFPA